MPTKLDKLFINEVSGVDDPANQSPGWALMKQRAEATEDLLKTVDAMLMIGRLNDELVAKADKMKAEELQALVANLLELFAVLSAEDKKEILEALDPDVSKAMTNAFLLAQATAHVPTAEDGLFATVHRTGRRITAT